MSENTFTSHLGIAVPEGLATDFLAKLCYVAEDLLDFRFVDEKRDQIRFTLKSPNPDRLQLVAERIAEVARKMSRGFKARAPKVLVNHLARPVPGQIDPHPELLASGDLIQYGRGRFALGPKLSKVFELLNRQTKQLAAPFNAPAYHFPALIGADLLNRCRYLNQFPHSLSFVSHLNEDLADIQGFAASAGFQNDQFTYDPAHISKAECLLAPSVCFHYYGALHDSTLTEDKIITALGKCFRYESGNMGGLERLWDFNMREIIFVGSKNHVETNKKQSLEMTCRLFDSWGLAYEVSSANDPFFIEDYASQTTFQNAFDLKFEVRALLPYKKSTLAVASFNYHHDFFGRSFNIKTTQGQPVCTGCAGFGLERLVLALAAQFGTDLKQWPTSLSDELTNVRN